MRVALISQSYPPMISGAAEVVNRLARGLVRRGHAVLVIAAAPMPRAPRAVTTGADGVALALLPSLPNPFRVGQRFTLASESRLAPILDAFAPEAVHAHDPGPLGLAGLRWARRRGVRCVYTAHQLPWFLSASAPTGLRAAARATEAPAWRLLERLCAQSDVVVAPSATIAAVMATHGITARVIGNGIDLDRFRPAISGPGESETLRRRFGLHPDLPIALHIGRLDRDKQPARALEAIVCALRQTPGQALVVGDGTERRRLERRARGWSLALPMRFTGYLTDDLPAVYRLARVVVSASEVEIQSTVALEAAASGRPLVAIDVGSMAELVRHTDTGWLARPNDAAGLCAGVARYLADGALADLAGTQARRLAEEHRLETTFSAHELAYQGG